MRGARRELGARHYGRTGIGGVAVVLLMVVSSMLVGVGSPGRADSGSGPSAAFGSGAASAAPGPHPFGSAYAVTFTESGLPSRTTWFLNITPTRLGPLSSNTPTIVANLVSGNYSYTAASTNKSYFSTGGSVTVSGAAASVPVTFQPFTYAVTFSERGLPRATSWSVTLGVTTLTQATTSISFPEPNGTYSFRVSLPGYQPAPASGSITVSGRPPAIQVIAFTLVTYLVTFTQTGLHVGTTWWVNLTNGESHSSATTVVTWNEPNGTYYYTVASANKEYAAPGGFFTVSNSSTTVNLTFAPVTYTVTFAESGLPTGSLWNVTLGNSTQSTTGSTASFSRPNGTYAFTVEPPPTFIAIPSSGSVSVAGANATEPIRFLSASSSYAVNFTETGLPASTPWTVTLGGAPESSTTGTIGFIEPNGTYSFTISSPGYQPVPGSGALTVNGSAVDRAVTFTLVAYAVRFTQTGVPAGTAWNVTLGRTTESSATGSLTFSEPNGTYAFTVNSPGYHPAPGSGSVTVKGQPVAQSIAFTRVTYAVTFTETGLPAGTSWSVTLGGTTNSSTTGTVAFAEPNGTYAFTVASSGYQGTPASGDLAVHGTAASQSITFALATYAVTFTESGLPSGTSWSVTLGGTANSSTTGTIAFVEPSGTYAFSVSSPGYQPVPGSGRVTVSGASVGQSVTFTQVTYALSFTETGLPSGASWAVTIGRAALESTTSTFTFNEPNGTYAYAVSASGYQPTPGSGSVTVSGQPAEQSISFALVTYSVAFSTSTLPAGTLWNVTLGGTTRASAGAEILFSEPNGSYAWSLGSVGGWYGTPGSGAVTLNGSGTIVSITFEETFSAQFNESGLPSGTSWNVTVTQVLAAAAGPLSPGAPLSFQQTFTSTGPTLIAPLPNGSYFYVVHSTSTFAPTVGGGSLRVSGSAPPAVPVSYAPGFTAGFTETGLPSGTNWSITVNGATESSSASTIGVLLPSGNYSFTVGSVTGYVAASSSGSVNVNGAPVSTIIPFAATGSSYALTFAETGLPAGTVWSVTVGSLTVSSRSASVVFQLSDGTYTFTVGPISGYSASPSTGTATVSGAPSSQAIVFSTPSSSAGTPLWVWIAIGAVAVIVVVGVALALFLRRRRPR